MTHYIVGDVTIEHGYVCVDGIKIEVASNLARNEFGYTHAYTWEEAARMGVPIWADEEGAIWCEDPDRYMAKNEIATGKLRFFVVTDYDETHLRVRRVIAVAGDRPVAYRYSVDSAFFYCPRCGYYVADRERQRHEEWCAARGADIVDVEGWEKGEEVSDQDEYDDLVRQLREGKFYLLGAK